MNTIRRYDIDWLRVIAIAFLLIYHIAIVFQPWAMFIGFMRSEEVVEAIWIPMMMLNVWRIPLLFFVSGMGVYFAMRKRNGKALLIERSKRILLPFLFGFLAITPLHMFIFQKYYDLPLDYFPHSGHLWFLLNIFIYVVVLSPLFYFLQKREEGPIKKMLSKWMSNPLGPLSISIFFVLEVALVQPQVFELYAETYHGFFIGFLAFFFGFLCVYIGKAFWETLRKWKYLYLVIAAFFYFNRVSDYIDLSSTYLTPVESICWIFGLFGLAYQYLNKPSALLSYLTKAVYPVYIIHMFVLYGASYFILPLKISPRIQFIAITILTFIFCFLIYEFILKRVRLFHPFFGMKVVRKDKDGAVKDSDTVNEEKTLKSIVY